MLKVGVEHKYVHTLFRKLRTSKTNEKLFIHSNILNVGAIGRKSKQE